MLSVLVDNSVIKTRADKPSDKERIEMYNFLEKAETDSKNSDVEPLYDHEKVLRPKKNTRCVVTGICLAAVIIGVIASLCLLAYKLSTLGHGNSSEGPTVLDSHSISTSNGLVHGVVEDGVHVFKGVPYAVPPVGKYRWKPPVPIEDHPECSTAKIYEANQFSAQCYQYQEYYKNVIGSEDCLYLNIWSPLLDPDAGLDVMVYIHGGGTETDKGQLYGGGLLTGSGSEGGMMPDGEIAKTANMVFVSFNYRLGPFGFMALNITDPATNQKITGNYGFMDQTLALKWVNKNIKNFGGNPNKVTVFGLGAGATSIFALLGSNQTKGLFQKAWLASPSANFNTSLSMAFKQNQVVLDELKGKTPCKEASPNQLYKCLQNLSSDAILSALPLDDWSNTHFRDLPSNTERPIALAIIDGIFLRNEISKTWHTREGSFKDVALLIGSSAQEVDDWPYSQNLAHWTWESYNDYINNRFREFKYVANLPHDAIIQYPHEETPEYQLTTMISDIRQVCGVSHMAKLIAMKWKAPVYRYIASYQPSRATTNSTIDGSNLMSEDEYNGQSDEFKRTPSCRYACHGIDLKYFFAEVDHYKQDDSFIKNMRTAVFDFVRNSKIKGWTKYPGKITVISSQYEYLNNYNEDKCKLWGRSFFIPQHTWMN